MNEENFKRTFNGLLCFIISIVILFIYLSFGLYVALSLKVVLKQENSNIQMNFV